MPLIIRLATLVLAATLTAACDGEPPSPPTTPGARSTPTTTTAATVASSDAPQAPTAGTLPDTPESFATAKRLLYEQVYADHPLTFYCGCRFDAGRRVDLTACGYVPRKNPRRAERIEAEHIVPAYWIGYTRPCWREPLCTDKGGKKFKGRSCCEAIDPSFETAHNDLHNLVPAVGEANGDRSNYRFGLIEGEPREYGACDFEVDEAHDRAEPTESIRGDIARVSFYMEATYGVRLSEAQRKLFEAWDRQDPVDAWERERNARIKAIQGNGNPFVEGAGE